MLIRTFSSVFKHAYLWKPDDDRLERILIGSRETFAFSSKEIAERVHQLNQLERPLAFVLSRDPEQMRSIVETRGDIPLNTDDMPTIEFHAARNMLTGVRK
jgi:hypothetical protein